MSNQKEELRANSEYSLSFAFRITLAISQYHKSQTIYLTLRAYSRDRFDLARIDGGLVKKVEISGQWKGVSAGGCANYQLTHQNNPKFKLTVGTTPNHRPVVAIELRGPKSYQVGFEVEQLSGSASFEKTSSGTYRSGYCYVEVLSMPPGTYSIVPTTFLPGQESPFFLTVKASNGIKLEEVKNG